MASKELFRSIIGRLLPKAEAVNEAGGVAYELSPEHALAQYAATGCLASTYYANADQQLAKVLELCRQVEPEIIARTAIYARRQAFMKDLPALLLAVLAVRDRELLKLTFPRVVDHPRMLRNFVQILRSGVVGRKSLGSLPKALVRDWLAGRSDEQIFTASVGKDPSLVDIVKMVHPKPATASRRALYGYLLGRVHDAAALPEVVREFEAYKKNPHGRPSPDVPFQMLTSLSLDRSAWVEIAARASWQMTRMNLNTFHRHGVYEEDGMASLIAQRLQDPQAIAQSRVFPYQLLAAYGALAPGVPGEIQDALRIALELSLSHVPELPGKIWVFPDASGSMHSPVTGHRRGSTTAVRCVDVAGLVAAAILRRNPKTGILPFGSQVLPVRLKAGDPVMTNASKLAALNGGGTNCSAPLTYLNRKRVHADLVVYVSDNESWLDSSSPYRQGATETLRQWAVLKQRCPKAKLVCIDIQPYGTTQATDRQDVLNIGGFSDQVFKLLAGFLEASSADYWVKQIREIELTASAA
ncbi:MAG: TROVE domain-containing protein [Deltaproteobacteria bacterium]|nr:TROVE domain-containing protein [Deltaproteobacteria bacterium]